MVFHFGFFCIVQYWFSIEIYTSFVSSAFFASFASFASLVLNSFRQRFCFSFSTATCSMFNSSFHPSHYRLGIHLVWNVFIYTGIAQLFNSKVTHVCYTLAALHMWAMDSSVRLFNKFICSAFQHHRHIWGIQCTKDTQMNSVPSFIHSRLHTTKIQTQFHFQWNIKPMKENSEE